ncbi:DNA polymerase ligase N-terminal domain-containing protein [Ilumatobacter sp.]|uniref:DNA polymerase ligase N-terminal domain-containing protein n=1 Tax=Ilumatobacter sp. TaxID=1967498 RepID=UPI003AF6CBBA
MTERSAVEPEAGSTARFVVHEHYATTHHFDLRLEGAGVLWSWAVPKGLPTHPSANRLAVRVDDHDLDHIAFEDPTPVPDVDGAVAKSIWDAGTYEVVRSSSDKLVFDLRGRRGTIRYALIHTGDENWLLHLMT